MRSDVSAVWKRTCTCRHRSHTSSPPLVCLLSEGVSSHIDSSCSSTSVSSPKSSSAGGEAASKLFIGQIPRHILEADLRKLFEVYGDIVDLQILRDKHSQVHRGCAFLLYASPASAAAAIEHVHEKISLHNRPIVVRYAGLANVPAECKLFVGMLSRTSDEAHIQSLFGKFGAVKEIHIMRDAAQVSKGCAFVKMHRKEDAAAAIDELNDVYQDQGAPRRLVVRFADSRASKARQANEAAASVQHAHAHVHHQQQQQQQSSQHHQYATAATILDMLTLSHLSSQWSGQTPWPAMQQQYATQTYQQSHASPRSHSHHLHTQSHHSSAAVHPSHAASFGSFGYNVYASPSDITYPASPYLGYAPNNYNVALSPSIASVVPVPLSALPSAAASSPSPSSAPHHVRSNDSRGPPGSNLFVYNLPDGCSDADLSLLFASFGVVLSARVFRDKHTGASRGFGFVSLDSAANGEKAIQAMNGFVVGQKRLQVMVKKATSNTNTPSESKHVTRQSQPHQQPLPPQQQQQPHHRSHSFSQQLYYPYQQTFVPRLTPAGHALGGPTVPAFPFAAHSQQPTY